MGPPEAMANITLEIIENSQTKKKKHLSSGDSLMTASAFAMEINLPKFRASTKVKFLEMT